MCDGGDVVVCCCHCCCGVHHYHHNIISQTLHHLSTPLSPNKHQTTLSPHLSTSPQYLTSLPHFSTTLPFSLFLHELLNRYPPFEPFATHRFKVSEVHELYVEQSGNPNGKVFKIQDRKKKERERRRKEMR